MDKNITVTELSNLVLEQLPTNVLIQIYRSSRNSHYIRFDGGVANSLRISNHQSRKGELNYMFNLRSDYEFAPVRYTKDKSTMYFYGYGEVNLLLEHISNNLIKKRCNMNPDVYFKTMKLNVSRKNRLNASLVTINNPFKDMGVDV